MNTTDRITPDAQLCDCGGSGWLPRVDGEPERCPEHGEPPTLRQAARDAYDWLVTAETADFQRGHDREIRNGLWQALRDREDAMTLYRQHFDIELSGSGEAIFDMLRFDACYPASGADAGRLGNHNRERRTVRLARLLRDKQQPTIARWASFGARVLPDSIETERVD